jgi:hypothetical protein
MPVDPQNLHARGLISDQAMSRLFPSGKTAPSQFLDYLPHERGGAAPLLRTAKRSAPSGRSMQTEPLPIGNESKILEAGAANLAKGPTPKDWQKLDTVIGRNSFPGDELDSQYQAIRQAVDNGTPFRHAMLKHGSEDFLQGIERTLKKDRGEFGLGSPEDLPWQNPQ